MKTLLLGAVAAIAIVAAPMAASAQGGEKAMSGADRDHSRAGMDGTGGADGKASLGGSSKTTVKVTGERKTQIRRRLAVTDGGAKVAASGLGVSLSVGVVVPREKVRISRLPPEIVEIAPEYASYEYFVTDDGLVVIVDPESYEVIDVIAA